MKILNLVTIVFLSTSLNAFATCKFEMAFRKDLPSAIQRVIVVSGKAQLTPPLATSSQGFVVGSSLGEMLFYNHNGKITASLTAGGAVQKIYKFLDGVLVFVSQDGYLHFTTSDGLWLRKIHIGQSAHYAHIFKNKVLVITAKNDADHQVVLFIDSSGNTVRSLDHSNPLSADPYESVDGSLVLPSLKSSVSLADIHSWPMPFALPGGKNPQILSNKNLVNFSSSKPLTVVNPKGRIVSQAFKGSDKTLKGIVALKNGTRILGVYDTGEVGLWNQNGKFLKVIRPPQSDRRLEDGSVVSILAAKAVSETQPVLTSQGHAIVPILESVETFQEDPLQSSKFGLLSRDTQITFYSFTDEGLPVPNQSPFSIGAQLGVSDPKIFKLNKTYILVQVSRFKIEVGRLETINEGYILDTRSLRAVARIDTNASLSQPLQISDDEFVFTESSPSGNIYLVSTKITSDPRR